MTTSGDATVNVTNSLHTSRIYKKHLLPQRTKHPTLLTKEILIVRIIHISVSVTGLTPRKRTRGVQTQKTEANRCEPQSWPKNMVLPPHSFSSSCQIFLQSSFETSRQRAKYPKLAATDDILATVAANWWASLTRSKH